ncbi:ORFL170C, partial [Human betaherpesvirus 5]
TVTSSSSSPSSSSRWSNLITVGQETVLM